MVYCLVLLFLFSALCSSISVEADMIGQWIFDNSHVINKTVRNAIGGFDATIVGPVVLNTEPSGLTLNGNNNYVLIAEKGIPVHLPKKEISAEAWVCLNSGTQWGSIINYSQDNGSFEKGWLLGYNYSHLNFAVSTTGKLIYLTCKIPFEIGQWYHVAGTFDGSIMKIYLNGRLENKHNLQQPGNIDYADAYYTIGTYKDDDEFFPMDGAIHEVRLYDTVLAEETIRANYESKKDLFPGRAELALGPYLRFVGPDSAIVRWRTHTSSPSILLYGEDKPEEHRVTDATPKTEHEVTLTGLKPNTTYSYLIKVIQDTKTFVTTVYECDTFFNYSLPDIPKRPSPYAKDEASTLYSKAAEHIILSFSAQSPSSSGLDARDVVFVPHPDEKGISDGNKSDESNIKKSGITRGYCLVLGSGEGQLAYELAKRSNLSIIGVDDDAKQVARARKNLKDAGIYGSRVVIHCVPSLSEIPFTNFFANLIVSERMMNEGKCVSTAAEMFRLLRPGGIAYLGHPSKRRKNLSQEKLENWLNVASLRYQITNDGNGLWAKIARAVLPGTGRWSHQYGSADNSANSRDTLQGAASTEDLEVQWVGRPGPRPQADRNGRKTSPLAINGRLFVQGLHRIIALDAYNGAILWSLEMPSFKRFNIPRDSSNWCADGDYVYAAVKGKCWRLDAATGRLSKVYELIPSQRRNWNYDWGYVACSDDKLFGTAVKRGTAFTNFWGGAGWYDATSGGATHKVCSENIFAFAKDSTTKTKWVHQDGVIINSTITIGGGRVYFVECRNDKVKASESRRVGMSELWKDQYLVSLDADNGEKLWEEPIDTADGIVMFHLAYGNDALYLLSSGDNKYNLYVYKATTGAEKWNVSKDWSSDNHGGHMARPAIVGKTVFVRPYCFDADSGEMLDVKMPGGGCGTYAASTEAVFFRAGNVTMWGINTQEVTQWHRLRPGCWLSTIPACGLVLSPEGGGGCSCGAWMETSIAFAPIYNQLREEDKDEK